VEEGGAEGEKTDNSSFMGEGREERVQYVRDGNGTRGRREGKKKIEDGHT
jgi:hypothetical protein